MSTPESKVKAKVTKVLKQAKAYYYMPVPGGFGKQSLDYLGCHNGRFFSIETKAGNKLMTDRQMATAAEMEKAGAKVFLINEVTGTEELEEWLNGNVQP